MIADWGRGDHLSRVRIDHRHDLAAAANKNAPVGDVHRHAGGRLARSHRPTLLDRQLPGVDLDDLAFVFQIVKDVSFSVRRRELWPAAEVDRASHLAVRSGDHGRAVAPAVESEYLGSS